MTSDEKIVPETVREGELRQDYQKITAGAVTELRGEKCNFYGLLKHMQNTDRAKRTFGYVIGTWLGILVGSLLGA